MSQTGEVSSLLLGQLVDLDAEALQLEASDVPVDVLRDVVHAGRERGVVLGDVHGASA